MDYGGFLFYAALEAIFHTWKAVCTTLEHQGDATAKGILKVLSSVQFVGTSAMLMDVIPVVAELNLIFQKRDLDLIVVNPIIKTMMIELLHLKKEDGNCLKEFWKVSFSLHVLPTFAIV